jgi:prepilin-type N-terminal cleavage/methylation domain-containing protein
MTSRKGASLIEVLVAIAILAVMIGLLIPAVQKVRSTAAGLQDKNRLRKLILAGHNYASANEGNLPSATSNTSVYFFMALLPYLEVAGPIDYPDPPYGTSHQVSPIYILNSDYSIGIVYNLSPSSPQFMRRVGPISMGVNATALNGVTSLAGGIPDGTSSTIDVSERLFAPQSRGNSFTYRGLWRRPGPFDDYSTTRGNFADAKKLDVVPVTEGFPPQTRASVPGVTFQVVPAWLEADGQQLQALQPGGLKVAMFDGSVRTIRPGVSESTFWGLVTPAAGDIAELD